MKGELIKILIPDLDLFEKLIDESKRNYSLHTIEAIQKVLTRIERNAETYGSLEIKNSCHKLEIDINKKIQNFHISSPSPFWFEELSTFNNKLKIALLSQYGEPTMTEAPQKKKTVVIVDDDIDLLKLLEYEFHGIDFETITFTTGADALKFLLQEENLKNIFLLVLDRMLPDMDGLEILQKLSKESRFKIPVLILSALNMESDIITGLQSGAIDYITKPFSIFMLMQKVLNLLKSKVY